MAKINLPSKNTSAITAIIAAAAAGIAGFTMKSEGVIYKSYQDPVGIWTICAGHIKGVHANQTATKAQCVQFFQEDMHDAMAQDLYISPNLIQNQSALRASGDLTFNGGIQAYRLSPSRVHFDKGEWIQGCNAFVGWWDTGSYSRPQRGYKCTPKRSGSGWACELPGLVTRRIGEKNICLGTAEPTPAL